MDSRSRVTELDGAQLVTTFARIRGMLLDVDQAASAVEQLARAARDMIGSAVGAGASLIDASGACVSKGTTDRVAVIADELQYELGDGPCLTAWSSREKQRIDDTSQEARWPSWCPTALDLGLRSVLSVPMMYRGEAIGALKVYSVNPSAFSPHDERQLVLLADAAATLLGAAHDADAPKQLDAALKSALADRRNVETATGMLMERHGIDHDTAREQLLGMARHTKRPLAELARDVVARSSDASL